MPIQKTAKAFWRGLEVLRKMSRVAMIGVVTFAVFSTASAWAQTDRGSIRGTVLDPTGAVVANANITVTSLATGTSSSMESTSAGTYNFTALPSGVYRVEVQQAGFKSLVRENVTVSAANITGLDLTLEVGNTSEVVNVSAEAPLLQTESSSQEASVDAR
ncbi:MAG: carboxypeptidase-like regulatory domain-containing protein, partial [Candidatus Korobacteraceae bacterium]